MPVIRLSFYFHDIDSSAYKGITLIEIHLIILLFFAIAGIIMMYTVRHRNIIRESRHHLNSKEKFRTLNSLFNEILGFENLEDIYSYITASLHKLYPKSIVLYNSVDEKNKVTKFESVSGLNGMLLKINEICGFDPLGRQYSLLPLHRGYFKSGELILFNGGLAEFACSQFPAAAANTIQKLTGLNKIYTIGLNKDDRILGAIHFFTFNNQEIEDIQFIESFARQAAVVIQKRIAEDSLLESEKKLKEMNLTKDRLFSIISHDLRSPVAGILSLTNLLNTNIRIYEPAKSEKYIRLIGDSVEQTLNLIDDLLIWSKSQTGMIEFTPVYFNLGELISDTVESMKTPALFKEIQLDYENQGVELRCYGDTNMLKTVLRNLIQNAIKFTSPKGRICIETTIQNGSISVSVTDNGTGISSTGVEKLFTAENIISTPGTEGEKGTGLGLVLCREFIEKHNGTISATSEEGKGSKFTFRLPVKPEAC